MKAKKKDQMDDYDYLTNAASTQDCTGLIPANPYLEESEAYDEIYHYKPSTLKVERK